MEFLSVDGCSSQCDSCVDSTPFMEIGLFSEDLAENGVASSIASLTLPCTFFSTALRIGSKCEVEGIVAILDSILSVEQVLHIQAIHLNCCATPQI